MHSPPDMPLVVRSVVVLMSEVRVCQIRTFGGINLLNPCV